MPAYPGGIPDVPLEGTWSCSDLYADPIITDMEGNNKRMRHRAGRKVSKIQFDMLYTPAQWNATVLPFIMTTLGGGIARFTMRVWNGSAMVGPKTVLLAAKPKVAAIYPKVRVTWELWVYNLV